MGKKFMLPATWQVPEEFRQRLGSNVGRQRSMVSEGQLLLVLHVVPKSGEASRQGQLFWRDKEGAWHSSLGGGGLVALNKHLDQYSQELDRYEELESQADGAEQYLTLLEGLTPLIRSSRNMLDVLRQARLDIPDDRGLLDCRDRAYEMSRRAELLGVDAKNAMDVALVRRAEQQAEASDRMAVAAHKLNVLVALFFPIATLATLFSTGFTEGWDINSTYGPFATFVFFGLVMGIILVRYVTQQTAENNSA